MGARATSPTMIGRGAELERLGAALRSAAGGDPRLILVRGDAGIGKTRLVGEFAEQARAAGAAVLEGTCLDVAEGTLPFGPVVEALRAHLDDNPVAVERLRDYELGELAALIPVLGDRRPTDGDGGRTRLFEEFVDLLRVVAAAAPLVLILEDLHWVDQSTRDLLSFTLHRLDREPVLIVCTARSDEPVAPNRTGVWLTALARGSRADTLTLGPLDKEESAAQMAAILGTEVSSSLVDLIFGRSEGNPLFVEELIAAGGGRDVPPALREVFLGRYAGVSKGAQGVLRVASVAGYRFDPMVVIAVSGHAEGAVLDGLQEASDAGIVQPRGEGYGFRHALLRDAVYETVVREQRRRLHREVAAALASRDNGDAGRLALTAHHWAAARDFERALRTSIEAARAARRILAHPEAHQQFERALEYWADVAEPDRVAGLDRQTLVAEAAKEASSAGASDRALALWRQAVDMADAAGDPERYAALLEGLSGAAVEVSVEEALGVNRRAIDLLPDDSARKAWFVANSAALMGLGLGRYDEAEKLAREAIALADRASSPATAGWAYLLLGHSAFLRGDLDGSRAIHRRLREIEPTYFGAFSANHESTDLLSAGHFAEALDLARHGEQLAADHGLQWVVGAFLTESVALILFELGRWDESEAIVSRHYHERVDEVARLAFVVVHESLAVARGSEGARAAVEQAVETARRYHHDPIKLRLYVLLAELQERSGEFEAAIRSAARAYELSRDGGESQLALWALARAAAETVAAGADPGGVPHESHRAEIERLRSAPHPAWAAYAYLAAGELTRVDGSPDAAIWRDAGDRWEALSSPYRTAYARMREAEAHMIAGRRRRAVGPLTAAHQGALQLGARPLTEEIEALARRGRVSLDAASPPLRKDVPALAKLGLSDREAEVLRHLAAGLTNREIGEKLFISHKTVSVHVSNILAKLQVSSRVQAAGIAYRIGLAEASTDPGASASDD